MCTFFDMKGNVVGPGCTHGFDSTVKIVCVSVSSMYVAMKRRLVEHLIISYLLNTWIQGFLCNIRRA